MVDILTDSNRVAIYEKYGKIEDDVKNDINQIYEWIKKQPHLPLIEPRLIEYLTRAKFSIEKAKQGIELYFTMKHVMPELFDDWNIHSPGVQTTLKVSGWYPLRKLTPEYEAVGIFRLFDTNPDNYNLANLLKVAFMIIELRGEVECNEGYHVIFDLKGFTLQHILRITPAIVKKGYVALKNAYIFRTAGYHILNAPDKIDMILAIFRPILSTKMYNRIKIHKDLDSLHRSILKDILPKEYGGSEPSLCEIAEQWKKLLENNREKLIEIGKRRSNEIKRVQESYIEELFGSVHGSFRQLHID